MRLGRMCHECLSDRNRPYHRGAGEGEEDHAGHDAHAGDGRVTIEDATLLQQYLAELRNADGTPVLDEQDALLMKMLDVNGSGTADIGDVTAIQQIIAELSK